SWTLRPLSFSHSRSLECGGKRSDTALDHCYSHPKRRRRFALPAHSRRHPEEDESLEHQGTHHLSFFTLSVLFVLIGVHCSFVFAQAGKAEVTGEIRDQ